VHQNRNHKLFITILIIHFLFFVIKISLGHFFLKDSYEYYHLAKNIKDSFEFYSANLNSNILLENYTKRPPIYSIFILVGSFLLHSKVTVLIVQNIISIASIFICLKLFKYYYKQINQKILIIFFLTSISQFIYSNFLMSEILFQFLIVLLCHFFHEIVTKKRWVQLLLFQIIIILLFLTKPVFYLFIIPNVALSIWFTKYIKKSYVFSLLPIIICALYMNWNYQRTGSYEFSSIQNINLKNYNLYYFNVNKYGEEYANMIDSKITELANNKNTYSEKQNEIRKLSLNYIKKDWFSYSFFHLTGCFRMFLDPGRFDLYNFFEFSNTNEVGFLKHLNRNGVVGAFEYFKRQPFLIVLIIPIMLLFNIFKLAGFVIFWINNYKTTPALFWFMLFIIIYIVTLTGLIGSARFLVPILPIYLMFAALGYSQLGFIKHQFLCTTT